MPSIKRPRTEVILLQGDEYDSIESKGAQVQTAAQVAASDNARLGDDIPTPVRVAAEEYDALMADAKSRGETLLVVAPRRGDVRPLVEANPPREDHAEDAAWGFNNDAIADKLVALSVPVFDELEQRRQFETEAERDEFLADLSAGVFSRVFYAARQVNFGGGPDTKLSLSERLGSSRSESSESPERLG